MSHSMVDLYCLGVDLKDDVAGERNSCWLTNQDIIKMHSGSEMESSSYIYLDGIDLHCEEMRSPSRIGSCTA